jgi:hypothetical protein
MQEEKGLKYDMGVGDAVQFQMSLVQGFKVMLKPGSG